MSPLAIILFAWAIVVSEWSLTFAVVLATAATITQLLLTAGVGVKDPLDR